MNQQIKTWVGTVVIIIIAVTTGVFVWLYEKTQPEIAPAQTINKQKVNKPVCGKLSGFKNESWANNFITQGGVFNEINKGCKIGDIFLSNIGPSEFGCDAVLKYNIKNNKLTNTAIQAPDACASRFGEITNDYVEYFGEQGDGGSGKSFHGRYYFKEDRLEPINSENSLSDWQTYRNEKYGFEFQYPKDWILGENSEKNYVSISNQQKNCASLTIAPINIGRESVFDLNAKTSCSIKEINFSGKNAKECINDLNNSYNRDIKIIDFSNINWGENNEISFFAGSGCTELIPLSDQILSTFKFTN